MSQRQSGYERKDRELYETPEWVTKALMDHIPLRVRTVWEPACGTGKMVRVLKQRYEVTGSDIDGGVDFLKCAERGFPSTTDAIITNPPYTLAAPFIEEALRFMEPNKGFVAMLFRTDFDHARRRTHLFRECSQFAAKLTLLRRIVWFEPPPGEKKAAPSYNHCWLLWDWRHEGPAEVRYAL